MAPGLGLVTADAGYHPQTSQVSLETLCSTHSTEENVDDKATPTTGDWLEPLPPIEATRIRRRTDVSQDPRYSLLGPIASDNDAECTTTLGRIPPWLLPPEETQALHDGGHGTAPCLIYARGVSDTPDLGQTNFDNKVMHPHPHRDCVLPRPRMRQETRGEDQ